MEKISYKSKINNLIEKAKIRANHPIAEKILGLISAIESIFFPIPVDPFF